MPRVGRYTNPTINVCWHPDQLPPETHVEPVVLPTSDRASTAGVLYLPPKPAPTLVAIMHPRVDTTHHYLIPGLLRNGFGVWAQRSRWVGNDLSLVHERVLIDIATAHAYLQQRGFDEVVTLGNSGGASLYALYIQQALRHPEDRLTTDAAGGRLDLTEHMPAPTGAIFLAPHPGQGDLLSRCIDPSVTDEADPAASDPGLDMFRPENGFREPPTPARYDEDFLARYRQAQLDRVTRIDDHARALIERSRELRAAARETGSIELRRMRMAPNYVTVYRTDADPRTTDLSLDPSDRDYGSLFGHRPDITNYGPVGFGRLTTPSAWLSTWSVHSTRAALRLTAPSVTLPTLVISYSADNSVFPADVRSFSEALGSKDIEEASVLADHYGYRPGTEDRDGGREAGDLIVDWLKRR